MGTSNTLGQERGMSPENRGKHGRGLPLDWRSGVQLKASRQISLKTSELAPGDLMVAKSYVSHVLVAQKVNSVGAVRDVYPPFVPCCGRGSNYFVL